MPETTPDPVTAYLVEVGERGYRNGATGAECGRLSDAAAIDGPRLLAAAWKALAHHENFAYKGRSICRGCQEPWPCHEYETITTALLGGGGSE